MEVAISAVTNEIVSRFITFLMNRYRSSRHAQSEEKKRVERLQHLLMRAGTIVEEADTRYITNSGMMMQLKMLSEAMYRGYCALDALRYRTLQVGAGFDEVSTSDSSGSLHLAIPLKRFRKIADKDEEKAMRSESDCALESLEIAVANMTEFVVLLGGCKRMSRRPYDVYLYTDNFMFSRHAENPRVHSLQIGHNVIEPNTMASANTVIPSVKILAVTVNFGVLSGVKMLASFLGCFPNIDTLHIKSSLRAPSVTANEPSGDDHVRFWQDVSPVECLSSHVKKMVIHKFRGDQNEFEFLKFIAVYAQELQSLHVVLQQETVPLSDVVDEMEDKLQNLQFQTGISGVLLVLPEEAFSSILQKATDLTFDDPFRF